MGIDAEKRCLAAYRGKQADECPVVTNDKRR